MSEIRIGVIGGSGLYQMNEIQDIEEIHLQTPFGDPSDADTPKLSENMRSYYTTTKNGKQIRVVTNMDESGKRMGPPVPPDPEPQQQQTMAYERTPEVRIVVENEPRREPVYEPEYPEYVDDKYTMPGFPAYDSYYPYYPYYPYSSYFPYDKHSRNRHGNYFPLDPNKPHWRYDAGRNRPLTRPSPKRAPIQNHGSSSPTRSFRSMKG